MILAASLLIVIGASLLMGRRELISGVIAGGLLGLVNIRWLVATARRAVGMPVTLGLFQVGAMLRVLAVGGLLGVVLIWGHVHPVGAVIGYGLFPLAASAAAARVLRAPADRAT